MFQKEIETALGGGHGAGNALNNAIVGNDGNNNLLGKAGDDSLNSGEGTIFR